MNNYDDFQLERMLEQNAKKSYDDIYQKSSNVEKQQYKPARKKQNKSKLARAIVTIALVGSMALSAGLAHQAISKYTENNNIGISENIIKDNVDEKIKSYEKLMNMYSDNENKIEIQVGRENNEPTVYYKPENLSKHLIEAAKKSELDTRCVIIAAHNIINEPYRNEVIEEALSKASANQEENSNYEIPNTVKNFLEELGYENWEEYNLNERNNIKDLEISKNYDGGKNR